MSETEKAHRARMRVDHDSPKGGIPLTRAEARAAFEHRREVARLLSASDICRVPHPDMDAMAFVVFRGQSVEVALVDSEVAHGTPAAIAAEIQRLTAPFKPGKPLPVPSVDRDPGDEQ